MRKWRSMDNMICNPGFQRPADVLALRRTAAGPLPLLQGFILQGVQVCIANDSVVELYGKGPGIAPRG
jgi:hypothetical protein